MTLPKIEFFLHKYVFHFSCEHKIECFTVSTAPIRSEIELHNNRYWDVLSISLYASIMFDVIAVDEFISDAKKKLEYQPQSLDEIGNASDSYRQIVDKSKEVNFIQSLQTSLSLITYGKYTTFM